MRTCEIPGCDRKHKANGLCVAHIARRDRHGSTLADVPIGRRKRGCDVAGCGRPHYGLGNCRAHYDRDRRTGDVRAAVPVGAPRVRIDLTDGGDL